MAGYALCVGPAILTNNNEIIADFAKDYDYNHFEGYTEDEDGIIWSADKKTLICFPSRWKSDAYKLPEDTEEGFFLYHCQTFFLKP